MQQRDYSTTFTVDHSAQRVFEAINNVRGWWGTNVTGSSAKLGDVFTFDVAGIHHSVQELTEVVPGRLVVWRVVEADLSFVADTAEWKDTEIRFEITETPDGTRVDFSHVGLVPDFECFDACSNAWGMYINGSLRSLITMGKGQPMESPSFSLSFSVEQSPEEAFAAINNVGAWWNTVEGTTDVVGGEFLYEVPGLHRCQLRVTELVPGERVVWFVVDNWFSFTVDTTEWTGTEIRFDISREDGLTHVRFEHVGLVPEYECFDICANAWGGYITGSLRDLIATGKGRPAANEEGRVRVAAHQQRAMSAA